jgi:hypothetical protein
LTNMVTDLRYFTSSNSLSPPRSVMRRRCPRVGQREILGDSATQPSCRSQMSASASCLSKCLLRDRTSSFGIFPANDWVGCKADAGTAGRRRLGLIGQDAQLRADGS